jgi:uncharacterized membrane protein YsdA (DUF1294 family)
MSRAVLKTCWWLHSHTWSCCHPRSMYLACFLAWQGLIKISKCTGDLLYLLGLQKAMLHRWNMRLWVIHITRGYYLADDIYPKWPVLWRHIVIPRRWNTLGLQKNKRLVKRMSSKHLVFCSLFGPLFGTLLGNGVFSRCERSWLFTWLCITWSLRRSAMIVSMIKVGFLIFRIRWSLQSLDQHPSRSFSMHITILTCSFSLRRV